MEHAYMYLSTCIGGREEYYKFYLNIVACKVLN